MTNGKGSKRRPESRPGNYSRNYGDIDWRKKEKDLPGIEEGEEFLPGDGTVASWEQRCDSSRKSYSTEEGELQ